MIKVSKSPRGGTRIYADKAQRSQGFEQLKANGWNYFVFFTDVKGPAIQYGQADWVKPGQIHVTY